MMNGARKQVACERFRYSLLTALFFTTSFLINSLDFVSHHQLSHKTPVNETTRRTRTAQSKDQPDQEQPERLGDGCYHIFLDVGANIGVHSRFLREPHLYPKARDAHRVFDEQFGSARDNRDVCTFAFEPNPAHVTKLQATVEAYDAQGWRHTALNVGVSDQDGTMDFYRNDKNGENSEWGFSVKKIGDVKEQVEIVTVPVIRLAKWMETHVAKRSIPLSAPFGNYTDGPKVVMKIDIEGMEYLVLPDLMLSGAICSIDLIFGEFHPAFAPMEFPGHRVNLGDRGSSRRFGQSMMQVLHSSRNCNTTFLYLDDESYLLDGVPLPSRQK